MKNNILLYLICTLIIGLQACGTSQAVNISESSKKTDLTKVPIKLLEVDKLGQQYVVSLDDALTILNPNQARTFAYQNRQLGSIESIDVTNPQKIMLYYKDYQTIVFLDNVLTETERINLINWEYTDIEAVAKSNDNNIWIYDLSVMKLVKLDSRGSVIYESNTMRDYNLDDMHVLKIVESRNQVFLLTAEHGMQLFDNYGQFIKSIPIEGTEDFQTDGRYITYLSKGILTSFSLADLAYYKEKIDDIDLTTAIQARKTKNSYVIRFPKEIIIISR